MGSTTACGSRGRADWFGVSQKRQIGACSGQRLSDVGCTDVPRSGGRPSPTGHDHRLGDDGKCSVCGIGRDVRRYFRDAAVYARWIYSRRRAGASSIGIGCPGATDADSAFRQCRVSCAGVVTPSVRASPSPWRADHLVRSPVEPYREVDASGADSRRKLLLPFSGCSPTRRRTRQALASM